jgi:hypothetical protein
VCACASLSRATDGQIDRSAASLSSRISHVDRPFRAVEVTPRDVRLGTGTAPNDTQPSALVRWAQHRKKRITRVHKYRQTPALRRRATRLSNNTAARATVAWTVTRLFTKDRTSLNATLTKRSCGLQGSSKIRSAQLDSHSQIPRRYDCCLDSGDSTI